MKKSKLKKEKRIKILLRIDESQNNLIVKAASESGLTVSAVIRILLKAGLDAYGVLPNTFLACLSLNKNLHF